MIIAVEGCCHGELDKVYATIAQVEQHHGVKVDLLLCCGDFEALRNSDDLACISVPPKYRHMGDFHKYYTGEARAPILTIFIGGNHEASNHLWELYYGGWVAPNIYFLGFSGVVRFGNLRIAGLGGIYNRHHYHLGYYERPPFTEDTIRSIYHVRHYEVAKLGLLREPVHIVMSHDWPAGIAHYGDKEALLQRKEHMREDIESDELGNPYTRQLLQQLRPIYWFAAHHHVKFSAIVPHEAALQVDFSVPRQTPMSVAPAASVSAVGKRSWTESLFVAPTSATEPGMAVSAQSAWAPTEMSMPTPDHAPVLEAAIPERPPTPSPFPRAFPTEHPQSISGAPASVTRFLALDKCLPHRGYLQVMHLEDDEPPGTPEEPRQPLELRYDLEWLAILKIAHRYMRVDHRSTLPSLTQLPEVFAKAAPQTKQWLEERSRTYRKGLYKDLRIPPNFQISARTTDTSSSMSRFPKSREGPLPYETTDNPQTRDFLDFLGIAENLIVRPANVPVHRPQPQPAQPQQGQYAGGYGNYSQPNQYGQYYGQYPTAPPTYEQQQAIAQQRLQQAELVAQAANAAEEPSAFFKRSRQNLSSFGLTPQVERGAAVGMAEELSALKRRCLNLVAAATAPSPSDSQPPAPQQ